MNYLFTLRLVWIAQSLAVVIFAIAGAVARPAKAEADPVVVTVLTVLAFFLALVQPILGRVLAPRADLFGWYIVRWAMCEAIAVFGLVIAMTGGSLGIMGGLCFLSLACFALLAPSEAGVERYRELGGERVPHG